MAVLLNLFLNRGGVRTLRRRLQQLKEPSEQDEREAATQRWQGENEVRDQWLREHPGRSKREYNRLRGDPNSEVMEWWRGKVKAVYDAEQRDYQRDHPGEEISEHECALSPREYTDLQRWRRQRARKARRACRKGAQRKG